jgi:mannose-6-phosphate isomerase-like protein (cupin superfamily)
MVTKSRYVVDASEAGTRSDGDTASVGVTFDRDTGSPALEQRLLRFKPGRSSPCGPGDLEEALFVLEGHGALSLDGTSHALEPETAIAVKPVETYVVENPGPAELVLVSVLLPPAAGASGTGGPRTAVRLADQQAGQATSDREFRVLLEPEAGLSGATQFVGYIPAKRAPKHYHTYDEVIYVLEGHGLLHVGDERTPIGSGSCIHLRPELRHCVENTGEAELRVLGVFRPAGDPAEAYLPDGTRAYVAAGDE